MTAQIFFIFPVLYGAFLLPRAGAIVMTTASVLGEAVVVGVLLTPREAVMNTAYLAAALVTVTVLLVRSAERQEALVAELRRHAATDSLTGLVTRRAFDEALDAALQRSDDEGTSLLLLDVDWFKSVNDRFGHPGGDEVLVQLSRLLVDASRRGDVVCRLGGDEMAVLMPGCTVEVARRRAEEIVDAVRRPRLRPDRGRRHQRLGQCRPRARPDARPGRPAALLGRRHRRSTRPSVAGGTG